MSRLTVIDLRDSENMGGYDRKSIRVTNQQLINKLGQYEDICDNPEELKEAWEKSQAKKPIFEHMTSDTKARYICECGSSFIHECRGFPFENMQYCDKCGQKIEWEDE